MSEIKTCEVIEKFGKEFYDCGMPSIAKCKKGAKYYVCSDHAIFAMVVGWQPEEINKHTNISRGVLNE